MRKFLISSLIALLSATASAGSFSYRCQTDVSCDSLFSDIVTDKYVKYYPADKWQIYVLTSMAHYSDGMASGTAIVGVRPIRKDNLNVLPANRFFRNGYRANVENAYALNDFEKELIRNAVTDMMAKCNEQQKCQIDQ